MIDGLETRRAPLRAPVGHGRRGFRLPTGTSLAIACGLVVVVLVVLQAIHLTDLFDPNQALTAGFARGSVLGYVLAVAAVGAWALFAPTRRLPYAVYACTGVGALILLGTLTLGGEVLSLVAAVLSLYGVLAGGVLAAARPAPGRSGRDRPRGLAGGRRSSASSCWRWAASRLRWWDVAVPILVVGALGAYSSGAAFARERRGRPGTTCVSSRLAVAVAALGLLTFGLACVWTAAPEVMFDALYAKAWLPLDWARAGDIGPLTLHPVLNGSGLHAAAGRARAQLNAGAVGRYLQLLALPAVVATVWWAGRRSGWAPLAAAVLIVTPHLFWQSTTADDDVLLMLGVAALALVALRLTRAEAPHGLRGRPDRGAAGRGVL